MTVSTNLRAGIPADEGARPLPGQQRLVGQQRVGPHLGGRRRAVAAAGPREPEHRLDQQLQHRRAAHRRLQRQLPPALLRAEPGQQRRRRLAVRQRQVGGRREPAPGRLPLHRHRERADAERRGAAELAATVRRPARPAADPADRPALQPPEAGHRHGQVDHRRHHVAVPAGQGDQRLLHRRYAALLVLRDHDRRQQRQQAGRLPEEQAGLLRAVRGGDGRDAAGREHPVPGRDRLHARRPGRRRPLGRSPTTTRTPGSRPTSPGSAGPTSTRRRCPTDARSPRRTRRGRRRRPARRPGCRRRPTRPRARRRTRSRRRTSTPARPAAGCRAPA